MVENLEWGDCDLCKRHAPLKKVGGIKICFYCYGPDDIETRSCRDWM
jgi:hypothetical protein